MRTLGGLPNVLTPVNIKILLEIGEVELIGSVAKPRECTMRTIPVLGVLIMQVVGLISGLLS